MQVRFWMSTLGFVEEFILPISDEDWLRHSQLSSRDSRMAFWREVTGDARFDGPLTALVVEPA